MSFQQGLDEFNTGQFYDCHETWEALWQPMPPGPDKTFLQGLIQLAVGCYHWQQGNRHGATTLLGKALEKLIATPPTVAERWVTQAPELTAHTRQLLAKVSTGTLTQLPQCTLHPALPPT
jgi:predicted metal-dependent hydrolase